MSPWGTMPTTVPALNGRHLLVCACRGRGTGFGSAFHDSKALLPSARHGLHIGARPSSGAANCEHEERLAYPWVLDMRTLLRPRTAALRFCRLSRCPISIAINGGLPRFRRVRRQTKTRRKERGANVPRSAGGSPGGWRRAVATPGANVPRSAGGSSAWPKTLCCPQENTRNLIFAGTGEVVGGGGRGRRRSSCAKRSKITNVCLCGTDHFSVPSIAKSTPNL